MLEESDTLLNMMQDELNFAPISNSHFIGTHSFWDQDSSNGADAVLPLPLVEDNPQPDIIKEDFQKMLSDWQEHLGTLQSSDSEEMDVMDFVGMDISMSKNSEGMPSDIFEDSCEMKPVLSVEKLHIPSKDRIFNGISLNLSENLNSFNLENFLEDDDEEEQKFGLIVAEEEDHVLQPEASAIGVQEVTTQSTSICPQIPSSDAEVNSSVSNNKETEEESVDVETVVDQIPVLEAGDLKSLLEQFEASEAFNSIVDTSKDESVETVSSVCEETPVCKSQPNIHLKKEGTTTTTASSGVVTVVSTSAPASASPREGSTLHETIRDSLPQEVIDRIKASNRRKAIPVIPAMPSRRPGRGATRMQVAAATLSRNKLLKLVSGAGKGGESIQLDHDYCSTSASLAAADVAPPKSFYHSNASEYASEQTGPNGAGLKDSEESSCAKPVLGENKVYSRLPEYYVVLAPQKALDKGRKGGTVKEEVWDKNSRKDSGLESGEVSDASEETVTTPVAAGTRDVVCSNIVKSDDRKCIKSIISSCNDSSVVTFDVQNKTELSDKKKPTSVTRGEGGQSVLKEWSTIRQDNGLTKPVAMVSVLKKNNLGCATNTPVRQQSLLISSNNNNKSCNVNSSSNIISSSNSTSTNPNMCSSSAIAKSKLEAEIVKTEGPKKKKLNLEEYRSRLKELDRCKTKEEPTTTCSLSVSEASAAKPELVTKDVIVDESQSEVVGVPSAPSVSNEKTVRPVMHSVEVQTQSSIFDQVPQENEKSKEVRSRKKQRKYRSKRASSSSSSHSTSSNSSHRHRKSRSQIRRRTSCRRSHGGRSLSSSGSQRPRSRSNSSRSTSSYSTYSSRSRSRSCSRSRSRSHSSARRAPSCSRPRPPYQPRYGYRRPLPYNAGWRSRSRSPPFGPRKNDWMLSEREKQRQVEERRVIYVGRIDEGTSKAELRRRFEPFGPIIDISVHFREHGDNYGFVTFAYKVDAYEAVEHGNDDPNLPRYDLCFGGRRAFCKTRYADLDGMATSDGPASGGYSRNSSFSRRTDTQTEDFDLLLREAQAKLRKRKV